MFIPITIPKGICLTDIRRLRSYAEWYKRQAQRHGPGFGSKRFARARHRRLQLLLASKHEPLLVGIG